MFAFEEILICPCKNGGKDSRDFIPNTMILWTVSLPKQESYIIGVIKVFSYSGLRAREEKAHAFPCRVTAAADAERTETFPHPFHILEATVWYYVSLYY